MGEIVGDECGVADGGEQVAADGGGVGWDLWGLGQLWGGLFGLPLAKVVIDDGLMLFGAAFAAADGTVQLAVEGNHGFLYALG